MRATHTLALTMATAALLLTSCAGGTQNAAAPTETDAPVSTPAESTTAPVAAPSLPGNQAWADITAIAAGMTSPGPLTAPPDFGECPDAADALTTGMGTRTVYWQGQLPGSPNGCQWADVNTVTGQTLIEQRYSVNIGFNPDAAPEDLGFFLQTGDIRPCSVIETPVGEDSTALTRCTQISSDGQRGIGDTTYSYYQPDSSGTGIWQLSVTVGSQYPGDQRQLAAAGLEAVVMAASTAYSAG